MLIRMLREMEGNTNETQDSKPQLFEKGMVYDVPVRLAASFFNAGAAMVVAKDKPKREKKPRFSSAHKRKSMDGVNVIRLCKGPD